MIRLSAGGEDALDSISYEEILRSVQELTPGYRTVFNLFAIEGFTHEEISNQLGISIGTSKSNLARARRQLQKKLFEQNRVRSTEAPQEMDSSKIFLPEDGQKEECALDCPAGIGCCWKWKLREVISDRSFVIFEPLLFHAMKKDIPMFRESFYCSQWTLIFFPGSNGKMQKKNLDRYFLSM